MTDETKKLFDAPLGVISIFPGYDIITSGVKELFAHAYTEENANRIARLPELYDALMVAARVYCPYASLDCRSEEDCPHIQIRTGICKKCIALGWLDLLKKVRDGE